MNEETWNDVQEGDFRLEASPQGDGETILLILNDKQIARVTKEQLLELHETTVQHGIY